MKLKLIINNIVKKTISEFEKYSDRQHLNKTVLLTGSFDIIHCGHIKILRHAKLLGNKLIVALDSDERVKKLKGQSRPFNSQNERKFVLQSINYIDEVRIFNSDEELIEIIKELKPYARVVGSDWKGKKIIGQEYCNKIEFYDRIPGYSTTNILKDWDYVRK